MSFVSQYIHESIQVLQNIDQSAVESVVAILSNTRKRGGRVFLLGVGGSAANCSHMVNDLRKLAGIETYAPTDNVSELTARTNDEGWASIFAAWLRTSRLQANDAIFVLSVGGGSLEKNISPNLVEALNYAKEVGAKIVGIVGRDGGYTARVADACVIIPTVNTESITPHTESLQSVIGHLIVSHPAIKIAAAKWESTK